MKKILFATTALALTAGAAAAETSIAGFGRFGMVYTDNGTDTMTKIEQRLQLTFTGSTETDGGVTMGGKFRVRSYETDPDGGDLSDGKTTTTNGVNAGQFFVSANGLKLEVGNVDGALDNMNGVGLGTIGLQDFQSPIDSYAYGSTDTVHNTGVAVIYSMGAFGAHVSYDTEEDRTDGVLSFETGGYTFAIGASDYDDEDPYADTQLALSVSGTLAGTAFTASYVDNDTVKTYSATAHFDVAAGTTIGAYLNYDDYDSSTGEDDATGVGADFTYDLGGGAALTGGVYTVDADETTTQADFGVTFNF